MSETNKSLRWIDFFISLAEAKPDDVKTKNIIKCLDEGADINQRFNNDCNNTPLHIAVNIGNIEIIKLLLQRGAKIKYRNAAGNSPLDIAKDMDSDVGSAIVELLEAFEEIQINEEFEVKIVNDKYIVENVDPKLLYKKRAGTSGIEGQLYVSRLLSLVLLRASLNKEFDEFYLGTGLTGMKVFYDVCMRYKKGEDEGAVFLQAIHMNDVKKTKVTLQDLWKDDGDYSLHKYYNSFLTISRYFRYARADDVLFKTKTQNIKCTLVIYTPAAIELKNKTLVDIESIDETAKDLISSGDCSKIYKYKYNEDDIALLTNKSMERNICTIARILANCILTGDYNNLLNIDCIRNYHVALVHNILEVSDVKESGYRIGSFRKEFLNMNKSYWCTFKCRIFFELVRHIKKDKTKLLELVDSVCKDPTKITITKLMHYIIVLHKDDKQVIFTNDHCFKEITDKLLHVKVDSKIFYEAAELAVNEKIESIYMKLPPNFGNIDIEVKHEENCENTLVCLAEILIKITELDSNLNLENGEEISVNIKEISANVNNQCPEDFNRILASAIGNLLILSEKSNLYKFNTNEESLGKNAKTVVRILKNKIKNIHNVRVRIENPYFPKLTFESDEEEKQKIRFFFNNLWFYTSQSNENEIEKHAKEEIQDYINSNTNESIQTISNTRVDATYYKIFNSVQRLWITDEDSYYLQNNRECIDRLINDISDTSLLKVVSNNFINKMADYDIQFNKDAIDFFTSLIQSEVTVLITEVNVLTGCKLAQCFHNTDNYAYVDLNERDGTCFSRRDYYVLIQDLKRNKSKTLIILYDDTTVSKNNIFSRLTNKPVTNNFILVTNEKSAEKLKLYIERETIVTVRDVRNDLNDLDFKSQEKVLDSLFLFQGELVKFSTIMTQDLKTLITENILQKIVKKEIINVGKTLTNPNYEEIKHYYVDRKLGLITLPKQECSHKYFISPCAKKEKMFKIHPEEIMKRHKDLFNTHNEKLFKINTLESLKDTVIIIGVPGIGKSTFLTHLSIETKRTNPSIWIERINLLDQTKELYRLRENEIKINKIDALKFVCKAALTRNLIRFSIDLTSIPSFDLEIKNDEIVLKNSDDIDCLVVFELKMLIHCYNQGNTILLFDGFDEICPHYKHEMIEILKCLVMRCSPNAEDSVKQRMWITSRSYNTISQTLVNEFGVAYNLEMFTVSEMGLFAHKYFVINLNIRELNSEQFDNINRFFKFVEIAMLKKEGEFKINKLSTWFLSLLYCKAMCYFVEQIDQPLSYDKRIFKKKWSKLSNLKNEFWNFSQKHSNSYTQRFCQQYENLLLNTPLHNYVILNYFSNNIKTVNRDQEDDIINKWDLEINMSSFYKYFIETKLKKIRFQEKNQIDLNNPDNKRIYERELIYLINKHKKLAFYASFKDDLNDILTEEDIKEISDIIQGMINGREKTGIVDSIVGEGIPKFIHLSFQEYLAVEYIADLLITNKCDQTKLWKFILNKTNDGFLDFFDRKLEFDDKMKNIITDTETKRMIFKNSTRNICSKFCRQCPEFDSTLLDRSIDFGLKQITQLLLKAMTDIVDIHNLDEYIDLTKKFVVVFLIKLNWDEILQEIIYCIRNIDATKLVVFELCPVHLKHYEKLSNEGIIRYLKWKWKKFNKAKAEKKKLHPRTRFYSI